MSSARGRGTVPALALALFGLSRAAGAADLSEPLREAVKKELPRALAGVAAAATEHDGPAGRFRAHVEELDGSAPAECVLTMQETGKAAQVVFLGLAGDKVVRKAVKLPGGVATDPAVAFPAFAETRRLAQVKDGKAGVVLLSWDGRKCEAVWDSGKPRRDETRWFELDDLDRDGIREIVTYRKSIVDVAPDDEFGETVSGSGAETAGPIAVLRWDGTRWRKSDGLLAKLR